jgi:hypothetical protein
MVLMGYEKGTKGYRVYDPVAKKLHISRDVIFQENQCWDWEQGKQSTGLASEFDVEYFSIVGKLTEPENSEDAANAAADPEPNDHGSPPQINWDNNTNSSGGSNMSTPPGSPAGQNIQFSTPPSGESVDS